MEMPETTEKRSVKGFIIRMSLVPTSTGLSSLVCQSGLSPSYYLPSRRKYGQDIQLPAYEDILSQEIAEEYSDVKSKADFFLNKENDIKEPQLSHRSCLFFSSSPQIIFSHFCQKEG